MSSKGIKLPGEEGEWEPFEFTFTGEPGDSAMVEIHNWPGSNNVRVYVRVREAEAVKLKPFDAVSVHHHGRNVIWTGETGQFASGQVCHIGKDDMGNETRFSLEEVVLVWRNGEVVWPKS